ncbi:fosmidomycin resistance protein [Halobaculum sp. CBA1158]|uniref:VOC family protein n=1 Tax=Halobaculum sp. CBA1158 TaxID=2904243 RepID=UPI001F2AD181|nr:VOC family protein [Halobaculum sp. CBA1158]UIP01077.1 fosmidomycin resistance protein [Halobaculum sp. CBA1158]
MTTRPATTQPRPALAALALEVTDLGRAADWYADAFGLVPTRRTPSECAFDAGGTELVLRRPESVPRGGLHTHFAFEVPGREYDAWRARFPDAPEVDFGSFRSLYLEDDDAHAPEIGGTAPDDAGTGIVGIFEVVLEVANVDVASDCWSALGFSTVDRGDERRRIRMRGPSGADRQFDVELWEPQLGLADARGGVHVDLAIRVREPAALAEHAYGDLPSVTVRERGDGSVELYDPDGHHVVLLPVESEHGANGTDR